MKVSHQIKILISVFLLCLLFLSIYLQQSISKETSNLLHKKLVETKEIEVPKLLALNAAYISSYTFDYSVWDQMVDYVDGKKSKDWADNELKGSMSNYKVDYIWVVNAKGETVYATATNDKLNVNNLQIPKSTFTTDSIKQKNKSFFTSHNGALTEVFIGGITHTSDKERKLPQKGYLILGRIVDTVYMTNLKALSADIEFNVVDNEKAFADNTNTKTGEFGYSLPLLNFDNKTIASLNITKSYPVLSKYQSFLNKYLIGFAGLILLIGTFFYLVNNKVLLKPLYHFEQALEHNNAKKIETYISKKNEFGKLSLLMTNFFKQKKELETEIENRTKSEQKLQKALIEKKSEQVERIKAEELLEQQQSILQLNTLTNKLKYNDSIKEILAIGAKTINCERVGIWMYNEDISAIKSSPLYQLSNNTFTTGEVALESEFPTYFKHLKKGTPIIAGDAITNEATAEFSSDYLVPLGITSMMDTPIKSSDKIVGVVCWEHIGAKREWSISEQMFANSLADIIALNYEREERRKAEELLTKNQIRFEETQELAHIGSWEFNFFSQEVVWSKEMYKIFDLENVPAKELFNEYTKKIHPDDALLFQEAITKLIDKQETYSVESRLVSNNGQIKYILAIGDTIKSERQGKVIGLRGTVQDITKQKQAALAKSDFLSCMSHEIRTPINGVIGIANLLQEEELNERQKEYVKILNFSANHLSTVVSDILDFSKIESGHMTFEKVSFNLEKNCRYVFDLFANQAKEKNLSYKFLPTPVKEFSLYGDYIRLNQVLSNLLANAIKFTEKGGVIFSYVATEDDTDQLSVVFSIKDTGIGISLAQQKQIFESFTQASEKITRQYGGTGLGLTISKKLVELQGGSIHVKSEHRQGSEFIVELKFDRHIYKDAALPKLTTAEKNQTKQLDGMKILVAEDNKVNAMVLTRFLSKWNIQSKVAANGNEVIDLLKTQSFDLILMDIQMPVLDGIEATKLIRESNNNNINKIPIVAFTADASIDSHRELLKIGFNHCITKPFNPDLLFSYLGKIHNQTPTV